MPVPVNLSKLSDVVKNNVVKKTVYDRLVAKVNNIDTSDFVLKTNYQKDKTELKKKIPDVIDFVKEANFTELKNKIPDIGYLATKTELTTVENKIPDVSNFVKNDKYIDTQSLINQLLMFFNASLTQANLITKKNFDTTVSSLVGKIAENETKNMSIEDKLKKLKTFDLSYFTGKSHFGEDGTQNYLVFQPTNRHFEVITNTDYVSLWKSIGLSAERVKPPTTSNNSLTLALLLWYQNKSKIC